MEKKIDNNKDISKKTITKEYSYKLDSNKYIIKEKNEVNETHNDEEKDFRLEKKTEYSLEEDIIKKDNISLNKVKRQYK